MDIKEIFAWIKDGIVGKTIVPLVLSYGKTAGIEALVTQLQKIHDSDELLYKCIVHSAYPWVDGQLEKLAEKSEITIDNDAVEVLKKALEESAAKNGLTLINVDAD